MASSFSDPPTIPDPNAMVTGQDVRSSQWLNVGETLNHAHATQGCAPMVSQEWASSTLQYDGAAGKVSACVWRLPQLSDAHTGFKCEVYAEATGAGGTVYFYSEESGNEVSVAVGAAGYYAPATLTIDTPAAGYDDVHLRVDTTGGATMTIHALTITPVELSSPLAAGKVGSITPQGQTSLGADYPLTASRAHEMRDTIEALLDRPRMLLAWSGVSLDLSATAPEVMPPFMRRSSGPQHRGARREGATYTVWWRYREDATEDAVLRLLVGQPESFERVPPPNRPIQHDDDAVLANVVEVVEKAAGSGGGVTWASSSFTLPHEDAYVEGIGHPWMRVAMWPLDKVGGDPASVDDHPLRTNAEVLGVFVWGP